MLEKVRNGVEGQNIRIMEWKMVRRPENGWKWTWWFGVVFGVEFQSLEWKDKELEGRKSQNIGKHQKWSGRSKHWKYGMGNGQKTGKRTWWDMVHKSRLQQTPVDSNVL